MAAKRRVQRAIQLELPSVSFDEEVVSYFACAYENGDSELEVVSAWTPFLVAQSVASDDDTAAEVCRGILRQRFVTF